MSILAVDEVMLREPRLLVQGQQPLGNVRVDRNHPFGKYCRAFITAGTGLVNLVDGRVATLSSAVTKVPTTRGNFGFDPSSQRGYVPIANVTVPFTLVARVMFDNAPAEDANARLCHLTKDTGLTTIAGFQPRRNGPPFVMMGQNYDGTNDVSEGIGISAGVWYDCFFVVTATSLNVSVNGVDDSSVSASWTSGPNRFSFFAADWGTEYIDGKVEYMGYFDGDVLWGQRANNSPFRLSPYEMLIPA